MRRCQEEKEEERREEKGQEEGNKERRRKEGVGFKVNPQNDSASDTVLNRNM